MARIIGKNVKETNQYLLALIPYIFLSNSVLKLSSIFVLYLGSIPFEKEILSSAAVLEVVYLKFFVYCFWNINL